ncbi:MAG TPA: GerMN domain-containing protein [Actinomycetota bacterium]|nr:GerMN domain-containing protein [Actinomycetota bacterium]
MKRALIALLLLAACRGDSVTLLPSSDLPADVYGSPAPSPSPETLPRRGTVYLVRAARLHPVQRPLPGTARTVGEAMLLALLGAQQDPRIRSAIPSDTRLNDLEVEGPVATVDLSAAFERAGSRRSLALRIAQVVYTLTEEPTGILGVRFAIDGLPRAVIGGVELTVLDRPVNRSDYSQFEPRR